MINAIFGRLGGAFAERLIIRDTVVRGSPAVRFNTFEDKCLTVFTVTQVMFSVYLIF